MAGPSLITAREGVDRYNISIQLWVDQGSNGSLVGQSGALMLRSTVKDKPVAVMLRIRVKISALRLIGFMRRGNINSGQVLREAAPRAEILRGLAGESQLHFFV